MRKDKGKGGDEHTEYLRLIRRAYRKKGFRALIEQSVNGKSIDVAVYNKSGEKLFAFEAACNYRNEVKNCIDDLTKSGFPQVVIGCVNKKVEQKVKRAIAAAVPESLKDRITVAPIGRYL